MSFVQTAKGFESIGEKFEKWMFDTAGSPLGGLAAQAERGVFKNLYLGRSKDTSAVGAQAGYRVAPTAGTLSQALYLNVPGKVFPSDMFVNQLDRTPYVEARAVDSVKHLVNAAIDELVRQGKSVDEAKARIMDKIAYIGRYDASSRKVVVSPTIGERTMDDVLGGLATPFWNLSVIQKVFKQPFLRGYAGDLVSKIGVPNIWADYVQLFTERFEGFARVSNVARTTGMANTSIGVQNHTGTMLSQIINLVIDYETPAPNEVQVGNQNGNWLTGAVVGDRDAYANLMLEQLLNSLVYFGHTESGHEGLLQIATRDSTSTQYPDTLPPMTELWDEAVAAVSPNKTAGADAIQYLVRLIADKLETLQFLPVSIKINAAPVVYKVLKFLFTNKEFNPRSPLTIVNEMFTDTSGRFTMTMPVGALGSMSTQWTITSDPMLSAGSPFITSTSSEDLMFIVFDKFQSALDDNNLSDLVMMPTPIESMILPSAPGFRDGVVRTALKRVGSVLAPVTGCVHAVYGFGQNLRYGST